MKKILGVMTIAGIVLLMISATAFATTTKVGNGDDGSDLEGAQKVETGILAETRLKAVEKLNALHVQNIENLGVLIPEVEKSDLYLVKGNLKPRLKSDKGMEGTPDASSVYARTFAEPHAVTRFFPSALMLGQEQLIALHIHEGLHRALPAQVREDEEVVSKITLAITGPDSSYDRVLKVVQQNIRPPEPVAFTPGGGAAGANIIATYQGPRAPDLENPSSVTYSYRSYFQPKETAAYPVLAMHLLESQLYPFGVGGHATGIGIQFSFLQLPDHALMGPLALSARTRLTTIRGFDVGAFATYAMNTLSDDELKNSPLGRDVTTVGLSLKRDGKNYYAENLLGFSLAGSANQKLGGINYEHDYGTITAATVRAGAKFYGFEFGGFGEMLLSDYYRVRGGAFAFDSGRYRIFSAGPELVFNYEALRLAVSGRFVVDATSGVNLDYLGDILGQGMGQGFVNSSLSLRF